MTNVSNGLFDDEVTDDGRRGRGGRAGRDRPPRRRSRRPTAAASTRRERWCSTCAALNKHGLSGNFKLADLEFGPGDCVAGQPAAQRLEITDTALEGPDYSELRYSIIAGNPVYAPAPLRGLLDIQPCAETQAADDPDTGTKPVSFWKDWKGMLWTRAAGDMTMQYFYPLQTGFYLDDDVRDRPSAWSIRTTRTWS